MVLIFSVSVLCFCFVCLHIVSCDPNVADVSGLSILDYAFCFFPSVYLVRFKFLSFWDYKHMNILT